MQQNPPSQDSPVPVKVSHSLQRNILNCSHQTGCTNLYLVIWFARSGPILPTSFLVVLLTTSLHVPCTTILYLVYEQINLDPVDSHENPECRCRSPLSSRDFIAVTTTKFRFVAVAHARRSCQAKLLGLCARATLTRSYSPCLGCAMWIRSHSAGSETFPTLCGVETHHDTILLITSPHYRNRQSGIRISFKRSFRPRGPYGRRFSVEQSKCNTQKSANLQPCWTMRRTTETQANHNFEIS